MAVISPYMIQWCKHNYSVTSFILWLENSHMLMEVIFDVLSCFFHTMNWNVSNKFCDHFLTSLLALSFQVLGHSWRSFPWGQGQNVLGSRRCLWLEMWWMIAMPRQSLAELFCCELQQEGGHTELSPFIFHCLVFLRWKNVSVASNTRKCYVWPIFGCCQM